MVTSAKAFTQQFKTFSLPIYISFSPFFLLPRRFTVRVGRVPVFSLLHCFCYIGPFYYDYSQPISWKLPIIWLVGWSPVVHVIRQLHSRFPIYSSTHFIFINPVTLASLSLLSSSSTATLALQYIILYFLTELLPLH